MIMMMTMMLMLMIVKMIMPWLKLSGSFAIKKTGRRF